MSDTAGAGFKPVPLSWVDSVGGDALSVIVNAAVRLPAADGVKDIRTEHDWPGGRADGTWQVFEVMAKSPGFAPVIASEFKLSACPPLLRMVKVCGPLGWPRDKLPKERDMALRRAVGPEMGWVPGGLLKTVEPKNGGGRGSGERMEFRSPVWGSTW